MVASGVLRSCDREESIGIADPLLLDGRLGLGGLMAWASRESAMPVCCSTASAAWSSSGVAGCRRQMPTTNP